MGLLAKLGLRGSSDGTVPASEALAGGQPVEPAGASGGRRERDANDGSVLVQDAIGVKLMHGWLQNRHQTLVPLTLNVAALSLAQRAGLAQILATFLLVGRPTAEATEVAPSLRHWLGSVGGDVETLAVYGQTLVAPLPLNQAFDLALDGDLTIYTYVAALMASDTRYPASVLLCDMVQARFDLPTAVVRSAVRRYRR